MDDAGVIQVRDDLAIVQTADIITPVVDDPYTFGRIAAANSLSDIYAMGAEPLAAINQVAWPASLADEILIQVLKGGEDTAREAGCPVIGGHTINDQEPKYGLSVNGTVRPDQVIRNLGARPGDLLYLTKPLGTGVLATALKREAIAAAEAEALSASMTALNRDAAAAACAAGVRALTDVTGFGLAGHLREMLGDGSLGVAVTARELPLLPGLLAHIGAGHVPGGTGRNHAAVTGLLVIDAAVDAVYVQVVCDPQTSGGLAVAMAPERAEAFESEAARRQVAARRIGVFDDSGKIRIV